MSEYRNEVTKVVKEGQWTFFKVLPLLVIVLVILSILGFTMKSLGLIGSTVVEREVFERSYQRSEGLKSQLANDEAVLAEVERQLGSPYIDEETKYNLRTQASAARIRISTTRGKLQ